MTSRGVEKIVIELNRMLVAAILTIVFAIAFIKVFGRYGLSRSSAWGEAAARRLMILGAVAGTARRAAAGCGRSAEDGRDQPNRAEGSRHGECHRCT